MKVKGKHEFESVPVVNGNAVALLNQVSAGDHVHGNISNDGKIGTSSGVPLVTGTDGIVAAGAFGNSSGQFCEGNDSRLSDSRTPVAHEHTAADVTSGTFDTSRIPSLDASKVTTGTFDIARIPAAAIERMVPVANQTARFALTTNEVQLGDTVKQLDTGIMYVVIDTANLANAAGYAEYTAATAAAVPWSGVQSKPTTLSGYGITDAAPSSHVGATGAAHGAVTTSVNGFMTAADKTKLDGVATGATANTAYTFTPAAPTTTGSAGSNAAYALGDHAHPSRIATSAPASPVNGDIWMV